MNVVTSQRSRAVAPSEKRVPSEYAPLQRSQNEYAGTAWIPARSRQAQRRNHEWAEIYQTGPSVCHSRAHRGVEESSQGFTHTREGRWRVRAFSSPRKHQRVCNDTQDRSTQYLLFQANTGMEEAQADIRGRGMGWFGSIFLESQKVPWADPRSTT